MEEGERFRVGGSTADGIADLADKIAARLMNTNPHQAAPEQRRAALYVFRAVKCAEDAARYARRAYNELQRVEEVRRSKPRESREGLEAVGKRSETGRAQESND